MAKNRNPYSGAAGASVKFMPPLASAPNEAFPKPAYEMPKLPAVTLPTKTGLPVIEILGVTPPVDAKLPEAVTLVTPPPPVPIRAKPRNCVAVTAAIMPDVTAVVANGTVTVATDT